MHKRIRRTKIVVTLGPSTDHENNLEKIIIAGANMVRLNFSHGNSEDHFLRAKKVREISSKLGRYIPILGDLQGPKIRVSTFRNEKIFLNIGDKFLLDAVLESGVGDHARVGIDYKHLPNDVAPGNILLLDDGRIHLKVLKIQEMKIYTEVIIGGPLSNNKGINKLGGGLSAEALTEKDKSDIISAAKIGVDYLAVSFPRTGEDIHYARQLARSAGSYAGIISKIERAEAVSSDEAMDNIIIASDAIMVARGDLGVEIGDSKIASVQKKLIYRARILNRAIITATQMMESMITSPIPTRAEVMDVANAVLDGTDAVMLSAETAAGQYPVETVISMASICLGAEIIPRINVSNNYINLKFENIEEAIAVSAMYTSSHLKDIRAVIAITESGRTALMMSRINSKLPIFALSQHEHTLNLAELYRGVIPVYFNINKKSSVTIANVTELLCKKGFLISGDLVILTQGDVIGLENNTNIMRIFRIE